MDDKTLEVIPADLHEWRKQIDAHVQCADRMLATRPEKGGRELALARTKLQEAKMWIGMALNEIGAPLPPEFADKA